MGTKRKTVYTEELIQQRLIGHFMSPNNIKYIIENLFVFNWESDLLLVTKSDLAYEFEVKISKSDFKNDFKHKHNKHLLLEHAKDYDNNPIPNYFYYAVPENLIQENDVPEYAGLVYLTDYFPFVKIIKTAPKLNNDKINAEQLNLAEKFYYNYRSWKQKFNDIKLENQTLNEEINDLTNKPDDNKESYSDLLKENKWLKTKETILKQQVYLLSGENKMLAKTIKENNIYFLKEIKQLKIDHGISE